MSKSTKLTDNKFVSNGKVLKMKDGRTNFATCTAEFLAHAETINKGTGELSDINAKFKDDLARAENRLSLYLKGREINSATVAEYESDIEKLREEKASAARAVREYMPAMTDADKNLYNAYFWYQTEPQPETYQDEYLLLYTRAFMEWFDSFGMTMGKKDFQFFSTKLGLKKASNKTYRKSGATQFTSAMGIRQFVELLYGIIIELMVKKGIIKNYELTYVAEDEEKTEEKSATEETPAEEPAKEEEVEVAVNVDYATMTVAQLKEVAKSRGVKGYAKMKKEELVSALTE